MGGLDVRFTYFRNNKLMVGFSVHFYAYARNKDIE